MYINKSPVAIIATRVPDNLYGFIELQDCERVSLVANTTIDKVRFNYSNKTNYTHPPTHVLA